MTGLKRKVDELSSEFDVMHRVTNCVKEELFVLKEKFEENVDEL